jgi:hypothetical protein
MIVREYRPTFIDIDAPLRRVTVDSVEDALKIEWVIEKGGVVIVDDEYVKNAAGWVVAIIQEEAVH